MRATKPFEKATMSTQQWWSCPGLLYFLAVGEPSVAIKIGMLALTKGQSPSEGIRRRLSQIQSSNHELVYVLGAIHFNEGRHPTKDAEDLERELHLKYRNLARFAADSRGAEWFNAASELIAEVHERTQAYTCLKLPRTIGRIARTVSDA